MPSLAAASSVVSFNFKYDSCILRCNSFNFFTSSLSNLRFSFANAVFTKLFASFTYLTRLAIAVLPSVSAFFTILSPIFSDSLSNAAEYAL